MPINHAVIKLFHRSIAIPTATYDEERSLYHDVYYRVETKSRARHFMQLHILQRKSPFYLQISLFAFFAKLLKFSRKFEKWSCKCKSAVKHKFRLNFDTFLENFLLKHNIRWQKWQTNFTIYQNLCIRVDFCTVFLSVCRKTLFLA